MKNSKVYIDQTLGLLNGFTKLIGSFLILKIITDKFNPSYYILFVDTVSFYSLFLITTGSILSQTLLTSTSTDDEFNKIKINVFWQIFILLSTSNITAAIIFALTTSHSYIIPVLTLSASLATSVSLLSAEMAQNLKYRESQNILTFQNVFPLAIFGFASFSNKFNETNAIYLYYFLIILSAAIILLSYRFKYKIDIHFKSSQIKNIIRYIIPHVSYLIISQIYTILLYYVWRIALQHTNVDPSRIVSLDLSMKISIAIFSVFSTYLPSYFLPKAVTTNGLNAAFIKGFIIKYSTFISIAFFLILFFIKPLMLILLPQVNFDNIIYYILISLYIKALGGPFGYILFNAGKVLKLFYFDLVSGITLIFGTFLEYQYDVSNALGAVLIITQIIFLMQSIIFVKPFLRVKYD